MRKLAHVVAVVLLAVLGLARVQASPQTLVNLPNPILFVTQVPVANDYTAIASVFGNHRGSLSSAGRGGDLWIRYADGVLKNLTQAAGYGVASGIEITGAIGVRDPAVYWDGTKALFSMVVGAPRQYQSTSYFFQIYEITGLGENETPVISKVPNQPPNFNNISPLYGTDDHIIFTSDRPRTGEAQLYPQLDEYEEAPTVTGLWRLDPQVGTLTMMNHTPSGAFTPSLDSFGRVVFTRWDHLQRDQQADTDYADGPNSYGTFNWSDEGPSSTATAHNNPEVFPEPRADRIDLLAGTNLMGHSFNAFMPWAMNEDGTNEETINHIGRHELIGYIEKTMSGDPNLHEFYYCDHQPCNPNRIENFLQIKESPAHPGQYYGVNAPEFFTHASGQVISMTAPPGLDADQIRIAYLTYTPTASYTSNPGPYHTGHYRDPLPMSDGTLLAAQTWQTDEETHINGKSNYDFRLKLLGPTGDGFWTAAQTITLGISKTVQYWDPDSLFTYSGPLWELQPVEVRARTRPARLSENLDPPEIQAIGAAGVNLGALRVYLASHNLALAVSRNVTTRDRNDKQQPFNLRVPGGVQTTGAGGTIYDIKYIQFFQADQLRGLAYGGTPTQGTGRRVIAQVMHDPAALSANTFAPSGPQSSVTLGLDGSMAAFVPARRAMSWQMTDAVGVGVVRERMWITFQPGEIRVCTSCHGLNEKDQAGNIAPTNSPQALTDLLLHWKLTQNPASSVYLPLLTR